MLRSCNQYNGFLHLACVNYRISELVQISSDTHSAGWQWWNFIVMIRVLLVFAGEPSFMVDAITVVWPIVLHRGIKNVSLQLSDQEFGKKRTAILCATVQTSFHLSCQISWPHLVFLEGQSANCSAFWTKAKIRFPTFAVYTGQNIISRCDTKM